MNILQYRIENTTEEEQSILDEFNIWLCDQMFCYINTTINRKKIYLRLKYINSVTWINWRKKQYISVNDIMKEIRRAISYESYKNNIWKIRIDGNVLIPNTSTSIDRLIRFIEYGDLKVNGTGMFTKLQKEFNHKKLNILWKMFLMSKLGSMMTESNIIADF